MRKIKENIKLDDCLKFEEDINLDDICNSKMDLSNSKKYKNISFKLKNQFKKVPAYKLEYPIIIKVLPVYFNGEKNLDLHEKLIFLSSKEKIYFKKYNIFDDSNIIQEYKKIEKKYFLLRPLNEITLDIIIPDNAIKKYKKNLSKETSTMRFSFILFHKNDKLNVLSKRFKI